MGVEILATMKGWHTLEEVCRPSSQPSHFRAGPVALRNGLLINSLILPRARGSSGAQGFPVLSFAQLTAMFTRHDLHVRPLDYRADLFAD
ncbi:MAG: hypothetical protein QOG23_4542 [Blastocatellia bacterium]|jgi:hypothetical protein|nr:hypothetical protein [Blastocatellia bacterium]